MYKLWLGFNNHELYKGCVVEQKPEGGHHLVTPLDSATVIMAENLLELLKRIPKSERDVLVLTGPVPPVIYLTAMSILGPFFKRVEHYSGKGKTTVSVPQPPDHFQSESE